MIFLACFADYFTVNKAFNYSHCFVPEKTMETMSTKPKGSSSDSGSSSESSSSDSEDSEPGKDTVIPYSQSLSRCLILGIISCLFSLEFRNDLKIEEERSRC